MATPPAPTPASAVVVIRHACIRCREAHIKCDSARPRCSQCLNRGEMDCVYASVKRRTSAPTRALRPYENVLKLEIARPLSDASELPAELLRVCEEAFHRCWAPWLRCSPPAPPPPRHDYLSTVALALGARAAGHSGIADRLHAMAMHLSSPRFWEPNARNCQAHLLMALHAKLMAQPHQCAAFLSLLVSQCEGIHPSSYLSQPEQHLGACFRLLRMHGSAERELLIKRLIEAEEQNPDPSPVIAASARLDRLLFSLLADARHSTRLASFYNNQSSSVLGASPSAVTTGTAAGQLFTSAYPSVAPSNVFVAAATASTQQGPCCTDAPQVALVVSRLNSAQQLLEELSGKLPQCSYVAYHTLLLSLRAWVASLEGNHSGATQFALALSQIDGLLEAQVTPFWLLGIELATKLIAASREYQLLAFHLAALRKMSCSYALAGLIADSNFQGQQLAKPPTAPESLPLAQPTYTIASSAALSSTPAAASSQGAGSNSCSNVLANLSVSNLPNSTNNGFHFANFNFPNGPAFGPFCSNTPLEGPPPVEFVPLEDWSV